jgi:NodT family efflux transporter outer membrane factor (OMF) lipoprotein
VPAELLSQRPDLAASEREIAAASADVSVAQADRLPRISLAGSIGRSSVRIGGASFDGNTWSFGPALLAPLFDAGRRRAAVDAAEARYDEAVAVYRERVLAAVREVEEALVRLDAAERREADAQLAAQGYAEFLAAAESQWRVGTVNLLDLEQARRSSLAANAGLLQVQRERVVAWLALYKAMGGGWASSADAAAELAAATGPENKHTR